MNWKKMDQETNKKRCLYHIRIKGVLNPESLGWIDDARVIDQDNIETLLAVRIVDQPALRGIMDQLWNLNFTILSVEKAE
jgi:hypothetical protein